jgi:hypothetical protein
MRSAWSDHDVDARQTCRTGDHAQLNPPEEGAQPLLLFDVLSVEQQVAKVDKSRSTCDPLQQGQFTSSCLEGQTSASKHVSQFLHRYS